MCGICGIVARAPLSPADDALVAEMTRALAHRGPDGEGFHRSPHAAFGMRRLSIIDLAGGRQPLTNEDGTLSLVLNGEIYNHRELQGELRARGHTLRTRSDAEVVLHLYEERGADALHALRGAFAFALHDARLGRVLVARDRLGEKPLYVHAADGRVTFASELAALLRARVVPLALDPVMVHRFLHYLYVPEPSCMVPGVRQLDAGCLMMIDLATFDIVERRWWHFLDAEPIEADPPAQVRAVLDEIAVQVIRSDVPVGVALSGGLDSSSLLALAARAHGPGLQAFSVGYPGRPPSDERAHAEQLAAALGVPLHSVELDESSMVAEFPATVAERGEPIADIAGFGHRAVMKLARAHDVPVLLTGYGGDELFWGYPWQRDSVDASRHKFASSARGYPLSDYLRVRGPDRWTRGGVREWMQDLGGAKSSLDRRRRDMSGPPRRPVFYELSPEFAAALSLARGLYAPRMLAAVGNDDPRALFGEASEQPELRIMERMFATYLRSVGLVQGDRLSMAHSVEARIPLVDYRLVETVVGLTKVHGAPPATPKAWLREAVRDLLPAEVLDRPKRGFEPPVFAWHRALMARYGDWLRDGVLVRTGVLTPGAAQMLASHSVPRDGYAAMPFSALVLEVWCREMERVSGKAVVCLA